MQIYFSRPLSLEWDCVVFINCVSDHLDGTVLFEAHTQCPDQRIEVIFAVHIIIIQCMLYTEYWANTSIIHPQQKNTLYPDGIIWNFLYILSNGYFHRYYNWHNIGLWLVISKLFRADFWLAILTFSHVSERKATGQAKAWPLLDSPSGW